MKGNIKASLFFAYDGFEELGSPEPSHIYLYWTGFMWSIWQRVTVSLGTPAWGMGNASDGDVLEILLKSENQPIKPRRNDIKMVRVSVCLNGS